MLSKVNYRQWERMASMAHQTATNLTKIRHCSSVHQAGRANSQENTAEEPLVIRENVESLTLIGLNRPTKRNALNKQLISSLGQAISDFENDCTSNSAVLYGVGGNFCAGLDLEEISTSDEFKRPLLPLIDMPSTKPIVASISGYAVAEGFLLALACDIQIIEDTAIVGLFNRRFGVPLSDNTIKRLVAHAGFSRAMDLILTGRPVRAKEAVLFGLATEVAPCGSARGKAVTLARSFAKFPQDALLADRAALHAAYGPSEKIRQTAKERMEVLRARAIKEIPRHTARFKEGIGKHGSTKKLSNFQNEDWLPS